LLRFYNFKSRFLPGDEQAILDTDHVPLLKHEDVFVFEEYPEKQDMDSTVPLADMVSTFPLVIPISPQPFRKEIYV
jgi:hypothetical protein